TPANRDPEPVPKPSFPTPVRDGLPMLRSYAGFERDGTIVPAGYVEATRGCHHTCTHCPITPVYGGRLVVVPRDRVIDDIAQQVALGARHITFGDPDFFNGPAHSLRIRRGCASAGRSRRSTPPTRTNTSPSPGTHRRSLRTPDSH